MGEAFLLATKLFGLPVGLLPSLCWVESNHRNLINFQDGGSPSTGVCQIKFTTAKRFKSNLKPSELMNPEVNIMLAGQYLAWQLKRYNGDVVKAVAAYNSGSFNRYKNTDTPRNVVYVNKVKAACAKLNYTQGCGFKYARSK